MSLSLSLSLSGTYLSSHIIFLSFQISSLYLLLCLTLALSPFPFAFCPSLSLSLCLYLTLSLSLSCSSILALSFHSLSQSPSLSLSLHIALNMCIVYLAPILFSLFLCRTLSLSLSFIYFPIANLSAIPYCCCLFLLSLPSLCPSLSHTIFLSSAR